MSRWRKKGPAQLGTETGAGKLPGGALATDDCLHHKLDNLLSQTWVGDKGETYVLTPLTSENIRGRNWSCTRWSKDGSAKKFPLWLDEATSRVWWGSWTYSFDPAEAARTGVISWYRTQGGEVAWLLGVSFVWTAKHSRKSQPHPVNAAKQTTRPTANSHVQGEKREQNLFTAFFLPRTGMQDLPKDFKPPPGLAAAPELQLFTLKDLQPGTLDCEVGKNQDGLTADDDTSAGSSGSVNGDSDADLSEAEHAVKTSASRSADLWAQRGEEPAPHGEQVKIKFARVWKPQLWR